MATPQIVGWSSTDKVPGVGGETVFGSGAASAGSIPITCLAVGTKLTTGTAVPNQDVVPILSPDDADVAFGAGSEIALQCYALLRTPGNTIFGAPVAEVRRVCAAADGTVLYVGEVTYRGDYIHFEMDLKT